MHAFGIDYANQEPIFETNMYTNLRVAGGGSVVEDGLAGVAPSLRESKSDAHKYTRRHHRHLGVSWL